MGQGIGGQANSHAGLRFARDRISVEPIEELRSNLESLDLAVIGGGPAVARLGQPRFVRAENRLLLRQEDHAGSIRLHAHRRQTVASCQIINTGS